MFAPGTDTLLGVGSTTQSGHGVGGVDGVQEDRLELRKFRKFKSVSSQGELKRLGPPLNNRNMFLLLHVIYCSETLQIFVQDSLLPVCIRTRTELYLNGTWLTSNEGWLKVQLLKKKKIKILQYVPGSCQH